MPMKVSNNCMVLILRLSPADQALRENWWHPSTSIKPTISADFGTWANDGSPIRL
jgi:hypothetical protein